MTIASSDRAPSSGQANGGVERANTRSETRLEQLDRNLDELTGELRVVVTGVQVLFAFLLVVPFDSGFARLGSFERALYFVTLLLAALAAACTIAPAAHHRLRFRQHDKAHLVTASNRMAIAGLGFLAGAMCGSLMLVTGALFDRAAAIAVVATAALLFTSLWLLAPLRRSRVWGRSHPGTLDRMTVEIDWASAMVRDRTLTVELTERPPPGWPDRFRGVVALLAPGRGEWGEIRLKGGKISVDAVSEGDERDLRHYLESLVRQANARREQEREPTPEEARDRRLAEGFRAFGEQGRSR